jgi:hypothetical protein
MRTRSVVEMIRMRIGVPGVFVTLAIVLAATGCAGKETSTATAPSPRASHSAPQSGLLNGVADLKTYLQQVRPVTSELATTVVALPDAVKGLSAKPDGTWTTSAARLDDIAAQLDGEASSLAALTPPGGFQPVQAAAVTGIREAQSAVTRIAEALDKRSSTPATERATLQSEIGKLQARLGLLDKMLSAGIEALLGSSGTATTG